MTSTTLFCTFTCPWLAENMSLAFPPCVGISFLFVMANFTMATFMDAGVLPRANEDEDKDSDFRAPLFKEVAVRGVQVRMKWCASCNFYRPPRCSHCSVCDHCVEDFDHHCPWVNNCIGRRNYRFFFLFLLSLSVHMVLIFSGGLLYVLDHLGGLWELHAAITLSIMSISAFFLIPVIGLACFHLVLVMRGRTTNEQVTGKFQRGSNPFTQGCCSNVEFVLCGPIIPSYTRKPGKTQTVHIQPPFEKPELPKTSSVKDEDNGIQNEMLPMRRQSAEGLDVPKCKRLNVPPPLPPKPAPILLNSHPTTLQEGLVQFRTAVTPAQTISTIDQSVASPSRGHYQVPREQVGKKENLLQISAQGLLLESCTEQPDQPISTHTALQSNILPLNILTLNSHSLSLKHAYQRRNRSHLPGHHSKSLTVSSTQGVNSLSYDSLHSPAEVAQRGAMHMNYLPPLLPVDLATGISAPADPQQVPVHTCSPVFMGTSRQSPVQYDSLPKHTMSSIEERHEQEEREKQPALTQTRQMGSMPDASVYDILSGRSVASRGPTPPTYGSREFLLSSAAYGYASSLRRTSRTSNVTLQSGSLSPSACRSLDRQTQCSTSAIPYPMPSSSYTAQRALAFVTSSERKDLPPKYES
ncbi:palmitoyltransferase ZDHHC8B [Trichomycterus rosablanca]|uniref:palmitoyltransferase ZDHHC8B n=1 Tax=Trichomycterus rosablanca TaxID=2290929 RepID=UPI002F34FB30